MNHAVPVLVNCVVEARVKYVLEAMICVSLSQSGVVVLWFATPPYESGVNGHPLLTLTGHVVLHVSPVKQSEMAESCVVLAYAICDVDDAKRPVWNHVGVVVAFVIDA